MSIGGRLRLRRLRRLHEKFLAASRKYPNFGHVACRSEIERFLFVMRPPWDHGVYDIEDVHYQKAHREFWSEAVEYSDYARFSRGCWLNEPQRVYFRGEAWWGRYCNDDDTERQTDEWGCSANPDLALWCELSQESHDHFCPMHCPPVCIYGPWDEEVHGGNAWVNWLYDRFCPLPERWTDPSHPLQPSETEWFEVMGLPCNLFLASAKLVELLADTPNDQLSHARMRDLETKPEEVTRRTPRIHTSTKLVVLLPLQKAILEKLTGKAMKKEALADELRIDPSRLYKPGGIKELMTLRRVAKQSGIGYYRPDAPPPDALELRVQPKGHQSDTNSPPGEPTSP